MSTNIEHSEILKVYKENYDQLTYTVICLRLANEKLQEQNKQLQEQLDSANGDDVD